MSLSEEERKAIVAYRIEKARTVIAEINEKNNNAIKLYQKLGFKEISLRDRYYGDDTAIIMEKVK